MSFATFINEKKETLRNICGVFSYKIKSDVLNIQYQKKTKNNLENLLIFEGCLSDKWEGKLRDQAKMSRWYQIYKKKYVGTKFD